MGRKIRSLPLDRRCLRRRQTPRIVVRLDRSRCKRESFVGDAFEEDLSLAVVPKLLTLFDPLRRLEVEATPGSGVDGSERAPATVSGRS